MTKYKITITTFSGDTYIYFRQSKFDNFFTALEEDLSEIGDWIHWGDCMFYDWEKVQ